MRRFLLPGMPSTGDIWIDGDEGRHLAKVLRARVGQQVQVFDGAGREHVCEIVAVQRSRVQVVIGALVPELRPPRAVTLVTAIPRGKRMATLVEQVTEAGVDRIVPLAAARSVRQDAGASMLARWRRHACEAAKQCGRARVPEVADPCALADVLAAESARSACLVLDPRALTQLADALAGVVLTVVTLFVGPEGGFDDSESATLAGSGAVPVALGGFVLRVETAAAVAVHTAAWSVPAAP